MMKTLSTSRIGLLVAGAALLSGCANAPKPLYSWDQYQGRVYEYFQGDQSSLEEQAARLEQHVEQAHASGTSVPPGLHAHLGLLYAKTGRIDEGMAQFQREKQLFPESASFMDFLLSNQQGMSQ